VIELASVQTVGARIARMDTNYRESISPAPPCSGSQFHNYKGTYSVVLLAVVDAIYCFRIIDGGAYGKGSDGDALGTLPSARHFRMAPWRFHHLHHSLGLKTWDPFPTCSSATRPSL
ncbi:unnamed protein product, partial [Coregonus sp. 'balchen']